LIESEASARLMIGWSPPAPSRQGFVPGDPDAGADGTT
jgi:hypothetical protein